MARHSKLATVASLLVMGVAAAFLNYLLVSRGNFADGYPLAADFTAADGISSGSEVSLAGLKIGHVTSVTLDQKTLLSHVVFRVDPTLKLPVDSAVAVSSAGLTSGNRLVITPGHDHARLASGALMTHTKDYVSLETAIGQFIFGGGNGGP